MNANRLKNIEYDDVFFENLVNEQTIESVNILGQCRFIEESFDIQGQVGEGTYGQVFVASDRSNRELVALKKIRMDSEKDGFPITALREIRILSSVFHENIIRLREIIRSKPDKNNGNTCNSKCNIYMVFDFMEHDLSGYLQRLHYHLPVTQVKHFMIELLSGLAACHENGVLHRDLKLSNLLISRQGQLKIADFGLARYYNDLPDATMTNRVITLWYRPPELLMGSDQYGPSIDMWSVGCIFCELLTGTVIFHGKDELDQLNKIFSILGSPNDENMPNCKQYKLYQRIQNDKYKANELAKWFKRHNIDHGAQLVLSKLLTLDPNKRYTAKECLKNPYFWNDPEPLKPNITDLSPSHEYTMKKKRSMHNNHGPHVAKRFRASSSRQHVMKYHNNSFDKCLSFSIQKLI